MSRDGSLPRRSARITWALATATLLGCSSYRVVHASEGLGSVKRVAVQTLENGSFETGVELLVTDALRRELRRRGGVEVVAEPERADLVLSGRVLDLVTTVRSFSSIAFALEYQVEMRLVLRARHPDGKDITIDAGTLRDWEVYLTSADVEAERRNRDEALRRLAAVLATRVGDSLAERLVQ